MSGPGPGYHHHNQPGEAHRRTSSNSPPRRAHDGTPYGGYNKRRVDNPALVPTSIRNDRSYTSSDGRPRGPQADLLQHAYSSHGRFLNSPLAYSSPYSNGPGMAGRVTPEQAHTNARKVPSIEPSGAAPQLRSRSSDRRFSGPIPSSSLPTSSSPVLGPTHRPSSAASGATSSHLLNERLLKSYEKNGPGEATLLPFSSSPPHPTRTDIIDDRPEIHAPQPSRLKPWKDILATRSDMLGLDKPPPRPPQCPPVPRKDSPHQGA